MSSGFITEAELAEARKQRQEEWEKVRTGDQPLERPEELYDGRSLFERLQEQKMKKDLEYEESHKLKNLIKGLDDDEVQFLELIDKNKLETEKQQMMEEEKELTEFRNRVASLQEEAEAKKMQNELKSNKTKPNTTTGTTTKPSQKSLIGLGIKRKNDEDISSTTSSKTNKLDSGDKSSQNNNQKAKVLDEIVTNNFDKGALKCVGVLPGMGCYTESSDSELSSGSDEEPDGVFGKYDLCGRKKECKKKHSHSD